MLFTPVTVSAPCQGVAHQYQEKAARAEWNVCFYQDFDAAVQMGAQGMPDEEINQKAWDAACEEQDTVGAVTHKKMLLCSHCVHTIASTHGGESSASLMIMGAMVAARSFLLASDRITETATIVGTFPRNIQDDQVLEMLQNTEKIPIHFK
jgi:hypothetical protein